MYTLYHIVVRGLETYLYNTYYLEKKRYDILFKKYRILSLRPLKEVRLLEPGGPLFLLLGPLVEVLLYNDYIYIMMSKDGM